VCKPLVDGTGRALHADAAVPKLAAAAAAHEPSARGGAGAAAVAGAAAQTRRAAAAGGGAPAAHGAEQAHVGRAMEEGGYGFFYILL
jgi:hypothetical protein